MEKDDWDYETEYERLKEKFKLPKFQEFAEDFDIEKIAEKETMFLLREIRRTMNEKLSAYLHLFETLINPSAPPMFIFSVLKKTNGDNKESIKEVYKRISRLQLKVMKLDTLYDEVKEAAFIKVAFKECL